MHRLCDLCLKEIAIWALCSDEPDVLKPLLSGCTQLAYNWRLPWPRSGAVEAEGDGYSFVTRCEGAQRTGEVEHLFVSHCDRAQRSRRRWEFIHIPLRPNGGRSGVPNLDCDFRRSAP
jgi:hypothetical protein